MFWKRKENTAEKLNEKSENTVKEEKTEKACTG